MNEGYALPYGDRERLKNEANYKTLEGAFDVILAHFERSKESWYSAKGRKSEHPSYRDYATAYVANPHCVNIFGEKVTNELRRRYPGKRNPHLPNGSSYWHRSLKKARQFEEYWKEDALPPKR